ncbi:MAG: GTPase HflX [Gammaproteobacteria bacterium]|nr:GTPase HflX [Gammaproteobacteria bacterium]
MFERPQAGEKAILVHLTITSFDEEGDVSEFEQLAISAGAQPLQVVTGTRAGPDPKFFIGKGKAEEIAELVKTLAAEVVIFDHSLSPAQERNLERLFQCRVLDRTGLILDIFAQRARSFEGKLQVELAQLQHLSTRLVRGWTHLERQKGGIGLRGPGETQLETDRRLLGARIKQINKRLEKVQRQRDQGRRARTRAEMPTVSLVGYTNAGKSTLFNAVTGSQVYAADQLFATLDPTLRRLDLADAGPAVLADTVGFVRKLPHDLVAAFRSTLEETREADLLLHVIDAADPEHLERIKQVNEVLRDIGADEVPQIQVYNKIDLIENAKPHIDYNEDGKPSRVWLSAAKAQGLDVLVDALKEYFAPGIRHCWVTLPHQAGKVRAALYEQNLVISEQLDEQGRCVLEVKAQPQTLERILPADAQVNEKYPPNAGTALAGEG